MPSFTPAVPDPYLRRWMLFVDGENFTMRGQEYARANSLQLEKAVYLKDTYLWLSQMEATSTLAAMAFPGMLQPNATGAYYYTSAVGDTNKIDDIKKALWELSFRPTVAKKTKERHGKGVDIALAKDILSHAFHNNFDVALLATSDADFVPVAEEIQRLGKSIYLLTVGTTGLSDTLRYAVDTHCDLAPAFRTYCSAK